MGWKIHACPCSAQYSHRLVLLPWTFSHRESGWSSTGLDSSWWLMLGPHLQIEKEVTVSQLCQHRLQAQISGGRSGLIFVDLLIDLNFSLSIEANTEQMSRLWTPHSLVFLPSSSDSPFGLGTNTGSDGKHLSSSQDTIFLVSVSNFATYSEWTDETHSTKTPMQVRSYLQTQKYQYTTQHNRLISLCSTLFCVQITERAVKFSYHMRLPDNMMSSWCSHECTLYFMRESSPFNEHRYQKTFSKSYVGLLTVINYNKWVTNKRKKTERLTPAVVESEFCYAEVGIFAGMALRHVSYQGKTYMVIKKQSSSEGSPLFCCEIFWHPLFF